jgi:DNA polymerase delta subunit 2
LEDDTGRLILREKEPLFLNTLVTGVVLAIKGVALPGGEFEIEEVCYPDLGTQAPVTLKADKDARYVALVSGLRVGDVNQNPLAFELLSEFLTGDLGSMQEHEFASKVIRVIVAGNALCPPTTSSDGITTKNFQQVRKTMTLCNKSL